MKATLALAIVVGSIGCVAVVNGDTNAESLARALSDAADACLLDVRDKQIPYNRSRNCTTRLGQAATNYTADLNIKLHYSKGPVPYHAYLAANARATGWTAAAYSNFKYPDDPILSLW